MTRPIPDLLGPMNVSRETMDRLAVFENLIRKWNPKINLVSKNSLENVWHRHILDSIQVFRSAPRARKWVDLGTGGGFPGVVVAALCADESPETQVVLIESDQRKAAFLRTVARETGLDCKVIGERIEIAESQRADVISARALANLSTLLELSQRHLSAEGTAMFQKGATWQSEVEIARNRWHFQVEIVKSVTEPEAVILKVKGISLV